MTTSDTGRLFKVRSRHGDSQGGRLVREASSHAAAIAYAEHLPLLADQREVAIVVRDAETGHEHSFLLHLDPGEPTTAV